MATAGGCGGGDDGAGTGSASSFGTAVQFDSESGRIISADFAAPAGVQNPPGILLLHQFGGSRAQWAAFAPQLTAAGYAVLAPDLDYSAINSCPKGDAGYQCRADTVQGLVADVRGGLLYLESRPSLDTSRIAVVGASFGGNLAYVASGEFADVDAGGHGVALLEHHQRVALVHRLALLTEDFDDRARVFGLDLHLHQ